MNNRILVIAGMHRSGTSLVTQWLHKCRLPVGDRLLPAGVGNIDGHFEDLDFLHLHEHLLTHYHHASNGLQLETLPHCSPLQKEQLAALVSRKQQQHHSWGWKDPRTCLFLPAYREIAPEAYYLVVVRSYTAVVSSLLSRAHKDTAQLYAQKSRMKRLLWYAIESRRRKKLIMRKSADSFLKAYILYNESLLAHIQSLPADKYLVVDETVLNRHDRFIFLHLQQKWHFPLVYTPFQEIYRKELISAPLPFQRYIKDKSLLDKAAAVERKLRNNIKNLFTI